MRNARAEAAEWESEQTAKKEAGQHAVDSNELSVMSNDDGNGDEEERSNTPSIMIVDTSPAASPKLGDGAPAAEIEELESQSKPKVGWLPFRLRVHSGTHAHHTHTHTHTRARTARAPCQEH
jgi:hypothetical protein